MTDNEKAATYVGWVPDAKCDGIDDCGFRIQPDEGRPFKHPYRNSWGKHYVVHDIPAPDMSKPENYMRAVAELAVPDNWERADGGFSKALYLTALGHPGPPIVTFLAALYDAEHPS